MEEAVYTKMLLFLLFLNENPVKVGALF